MPRDRMLRRVFAAGLVCSIALAGVAFDAASAGPPPSPETPAEANDFLDRFLGHWIGEGTFDGAPIQNDLVCERVLGGLYVLMRDREIGGDEFEADMYLGYDVADAQYELYVFGSFTGFGGGLPTRSMTGRRSGDVLVLQEAPARQRLRYTLDFLDEDTFQLTKAWVTGRNVRPFVTETFRRQPPD